MEDNKLFSNEIRVVINSNVEKPVKLLDEATMKKDRIEAVLAALRDVDDD